MSFFEITDPDVDVFYEAWSGPISAIFVDKKTVHINGNVEVLRVTDNEVRIVKRLDVKIVLNKADQGYPVLRALGYTAYFQGVVINNILEDVKHGELDVEKISFREGDNRPYRWNDDNVARTRNETELTKVSEEYTCPSNLAWMACVAQRVSDATVDLPKYYEDDLRPFFEK